MVADLSYVYVAQWVYKSLKWIASFSPCLHVIILVYKIWEAKIVFIGSMCEKCSFPNADKSFL